MAVADGRRKVFLRTGVVFLVLVFVSLGFFYSYGYLENTVGAQLKIKDFPGRLPDGNCEDPGSATNPYCVGKWDEPIDAPVAAVHSFVLPNGKVLFFPSNPHKRHFTDAYIWDPEVPGSFTHTPYCPIPAECSVDTPNITPSNYKGNLFCAGHEFTQDGKILMTGGHYVDGNGTNVTTFFDFRKPGTSAWKAGPEMEDGRWYPTNCSLGNGEQMVLAGSKFSIKNRKELEEPQGDSLNLNPIPQPINRDIEIWLNDGKLKKLTNPYEGNLLYPFTFLTDRGKIFIAGPEAGSMFIDPESGTSSRGQNSSAIRDYGSAVMYEEGKVMIAGGGISPNFDERCTLGGGYNCPYGSAEKIDLTNVDPSCITEGQGCPEFTSAGGMHFLRRQHNMTLLPDNKVLVTGGSSAPGHSNLYGAVLAAEIWDPKAPNTGGTGSWKVLAEAQKPRLYHSTAFLLPDGRVAVGGGEWIISQSLCEGVGNCQAGCPTPDSPSQVPDPQVPGGANWAHCNLPQYSFEIFSPPYLFNPDGSPAARPQIISAPQNVGYQKTFFIKVQNPANIAKVSLVRLSSVTHSFNQGQRINDLHFAPSAGGSRATGLNIETPIDGNHCPPGYYMLFIIDNNGVPSKSKIIQINDKEASHKFDFDDDRKTDLTFWRENGKESFWITYGSSNGSSVRTIIGETGDKPVPGDYDGDTVSDKALWRPSTGQWVINTSSDNGTKLVTFGHPGDVPVPADYDGDRLMDLAVWRPSTGAWIYRRSSTGAVVASSPGITEEDIPVPGYYDDDSKADIAFWRPSSGDWHLTFSTNGGHGLVNFGLPGDYVVPTDYDGDTRTDFAIWRPSNSYWYIMNSHTGTITYTQWGSKGDRPVSDDYDGDGLSDIAIWRPSNGQWWILNSSGSYSVATFGQSGDRPIPSVYFRNCLLAASCAQLKSIR